MLGSNRDSSELIDFICSENFLFTNLFNVDNLQILRYCKKIKNTIAYHIANLHQQTKYITHTNMQLN